MLAGSVPLDGGKIFLSFGNGNWSINRAGEFKSLNPAANP